jgi:hypothetical protein
MQRQSRRGKGHYPCCRCPAAGHRALGGEREARVAIEGSDDFGGTCVKMVFRKSLHDKIRHFIGIDPALLGCMKYHSSSDYWHYMLPGISSAV